MRTGTETRTEVMKRVIAEAFQESTARHRILHFLAFSSYSRVHNT